MRLAAPISWLPTWHFLLPPISVGLALWAQWALFAVKYPVDGTLLFAASATLFTWSVLPYQRLISERPKQESVSLGQESLPRRGVVIVAILVFALLTWAFSGGNRFRPETLVFWGLAVLLYLELFWERGESPQVALLGRVRSLIRHEYRVPWDLLALSLVVLLGAFFRYYQIGSIPAEPTSDHAEKLLDIRDLMAGQVNIFFPRNTGREPLQFYLAIPFVQLFGLTHLALKVEQATMSLLTIPALYFIGKEIVGRRFGLLAAFFLAVSKWDVEIARVGLRFPLYPLFTALTLLFLLRGLRRRSRNDFLVCGIVTGIGMYGYSPARALVLVIPALALIELAGVWREGSRVRASLVANFGLLVGAAALVFLPLGRYMADNPGMFWFRAMTRMGNAEAPVPANFLSVLADNIKNALLMFNWRGDVVWVNTVPLDPVLDWLSGGLFVLGVVWCLVAALRDREVVAAQILAAFLILLLPSILSLSFPGENPSVVRSGGAGPVVALLVATPLYMGLRHMAAVWPNNAGRMMAMLLAGLLLISIARTNFDRYFLDYATQYRQSSVNASEIAAVIDHYAKSVGSQESAYLKSYPHWVDTRNIAFQLRNPKWNNVLMTAEDLARHQPPAGNKLYIIHKDDQEAVRAFRVRFPQGQLRTQLSATPGKEFLVLFVPGAAGG